MDSLSTRTMSVMTLAVLLVGFSPRSAVADDVSFRSMALYHQTIHRRPMAFGYVSRMPRSVMEKDSKLAMLMNERKFEALYRDYEIRYFAIRTQADQRRNPASDPPVVYEDLQMRIYDLAPE